MSTGTFASRSAVLGGGVAIKSSHVVKAKVLKAAAYLMKQPIEELEAAGGIIRARNSNVSMTSGMKPERGLFPDGGYPAWPARGSCRF
jgi:carbon-monoxide dehydrogenase large subunit